MRWAGDTDNNGGANAGCSVSGTDFAAADLGTFNSANDAAGTVWTVSLNLTEFGYMVANNYGFVIARLTTTSSPGLVLASTKNTTSANRPKLVIDYTAAGGRARSFGAIIG